MNSPLLINTTASRDPTRTSVLRAKYAANMRARWGKVRQAARAGLLAGDFSSRVAFSTWLKDEMEAQVMEDGGAWQQAFLKPGYRRGVQQADTDVKAAGLSLPKEGLARRQLVEGIHTNEIQEATQRYSTGLQNITEVVSEQVDAVTMDAWYDDDLVPRVEDRLHKIGRTRGTVLAVTAIIDVFALGTLNRLDSLGFRRVGIIPETVFMTQGDDRVCPECSALEGQSFDIFEARGVLPVHPRCRCRWQLDLGFLLGQLAAISLIRDE